MAGWVLAQPLPQIELPEYIISGVEQATRPAGRRIASEAVSSLAVTELRASERPALLTQSVWTPPHTPDLKADWGEGNWNLYLNRDDYGYSFLSGSVIHPGLVVPLAASVEALTQPPTVYPNDESSIDVNLGTFAGLGNAVVSPEVGYGLHKFLMLDNTGELWRSREEFNIKLGTSTVTTRWGNFRGAYQFRHWVIANAGDLRGSVSDFRLDWSGSGRAGQWQADFTATGEPLSADEPSLQLFKLRGRHLRRISNGAALKVGLGAYSGRSPSGSSPSDLTLDVALQRRLGSRGWLTLAYRRDAESVGTGELFTATPQLTITSRGGVVEIPADIQLSADIVHSAIMESKFYTGWEFRRNQPFEVYYTASDPDIRLENRRLVTFRLGGRVETALASWGGLALRAEFRHAYTEKIPSPAASGLFYNAPGISPFYVGLDFSARALGFDWSTDAQYDDIAPLNFEGSGSRPARFLWNVGVARDLGRGFSAEFRVLNILNEEYWDFPGYLEPPRAYLLGVSYGGGIEN